MMLRCAMAKPADAQEDGEAVPPVKRHSTIRAKEILKPSFRSCD